MGALTEEFTAIASGFDSLPVYGDFRRIDGYERADARSVSPSLELPVHGPITDLRMCEDVIYATVGKQVFALKGAAWVLAFTLD